MRIKVRVVINKTSANQLPESELWDRPGETDGLGWRETRMLGTSSDSVERRVRICIRFVKWCEKRKQYYKFTFLKYTLGNLYV